MKDIITKVLTTATASLGGIGTWLAAKGLIGTGDIGAVNGAGASLGAALVLIIGAIATHLLVMAAGKLFRGNGNEKDGDGSGGPSGGAALLLPLGAAAVLMGGLPSCSALRGVPVRVDVTTDGGRASYDSKGGLAVEVDVSSAK